MQCNDVFRVVQTGLASVYLGIVLSWVSLFRAGLLQEGRAYLSEHWDRLDAVYQHTTGCVTQILETLDAEYSRFLQAREEAGI